jgi:hypothetical protein
MIAQLVGFVKFVILGQPAHSTNSGQARPLSLKRAGRAIFVNGEVWEF